MSNATNRRAAARAAAVTAPESAVPSPGSDFSDTAKVRWVEAISVVRSGVTSPRWIARPASIHSAAITISTSPGAAMAENTGSRPGASAIVST